MIYDFTPERKTRYPLLLKDRIKDISTEEHHYKEFQMPDGAVIRIARPAKDVQKDRELTESSESLPRLQPNLPSLDSSPASSPALPPRIEVMVFTEEV